MSILFINGSPNKNGNTVGLAKELLAGKEYDTLRWSSIFVTFTLKKIIDWNISFQTVSCIHLMNVDVYDCNSHIHNPACFHLTLDLFQTDSVV